MITAGSVRGNSSAPVTGSRCTQPALSMVVGAPDSGLNRARACHSRMPIAWASSPASRSLRSAPSSRRSCQPSTVPAADGQRPLAADRRVRDVVGLAEVDGAGGQLGLLVPHQPRAALGAADRDGAARVDGQHADRPAAGGVRQRAGEVGAVVRGAGEDRARGRWWRGCRRPRRRAAARRRVVRRRCSRPSGTLTRPPPAARRPRPRPAPSARSGSAIRAASPTTTAVSASGAM